MTEPAPPQPRRLAILLFYVCLSFLLTILFLRILEPQGAMVTALCCCVMVWSYSRLSKFLANSLALKIDLLSALVALSAGLNAALLHPWLLIGFSLVAFGVWHFAKGRMLGPLLIAAASSLRLEFSAFVLIAFLYNLIIRHLKISHYLMAAALGHLPLFFWGHFPNLAPTDTPREFLSLVMLGQFGPFFFKDHPVIFALYIALFVVVLIYFFLAQLSERGFLATNKRHQLFLLSGLLILLIYTCLQVRLSSDHIMLYTFPILYALFVLSLCRRSRLLGTLFFLIFFPHFLNAALFILSLL